MSVAIIGGGITGISIAYELSQMKVPYTLYERNSRVGGLLGSFKLGNTWLEKYFHHIFLSDTAIRKRIQELGLEKDLIWKVTPMGFYGEGKTYPLDGAIDLLRLKTLPLLDRLKFGRKILQTQKMHGGINLDSISAKEWIEKKWSKPIYEKFWGPLLRSKFSDAADEISAAWLWGRIYARANSREKGKEQLGYLRGGFLTLVDEMAKSAKQKGGIFRLHQEVKKVEKKGEAFQVQTDYATEEFDQVVFTTPSPYIPKICTDLPEKERKAHEAVEYVAILCMPILMNRPLSEKYWINVADRSIPFTGVIEHTNYISKEMYGGANIAYLFNYLPQNHPWLSEPKMTIFERYEEGLKKMFPNYDRGQVDQILLFRDLHANVIYYKNYLKVMPPMASQTKGLFFANTSHIFPEDRNQNYSIVLAQKIIEKMRPDKL